MLEMARRLVFLGSIFGFLSVALGAFGAHMLKPVLVSHGDAAVHAYETAVQYQMAHSLALLLLSGLCARVISEKTARNTAAFFAGGIIIFSGSLYLYSVTGSTAFALITPLGGIAFMVGWIVLAYGGTARKEE